MARAVEPRFEARSKEREAKAPNQGAAPKEGTPPEDEEGMEGAEGAPFDAGGTALVSAAGMAASPFVLTAA